MSKAVGIGITVVVIVAVGGGGYYYLSQQATQKVVQQIQNFEKTYPGLKITYEKVSTSVFSKSAIFDKVIITMPDGKTYDAAKAEITAGENNVPKNILINQFHTVIDSSSDLTINQIQIKNGKLEKDAIIIADGKINMIHPDKISFDLLNLDNIDIKDTKNDKAHLNIAEFQIQNYGLNKLSNQTIKQFNFGIENADLTMKAGTIQVNGIKLANILGQAVNGQNPMITPGEPADASMSELYYKSGNKQYSITKYESKITQEANGNLKNLTNFDNVKLDVGSDYRMQPLKELGYNEINLSGNVQANYDKSKTQWNLAPIVLNFKDMGKITADIQVIAPENLSNLSSADVMTKYKLVSMNITLQNDGLINRMLETASKTNNITQDQVKQQWIDTLNKDANNAKISAQKQADQAAIQLLKAPTDKIVLSINPAHPIGVIDIMQQSAQQPTFDNSNPQAQNNLTSQEKIIDLLNINVKAEAAK